jgi:hypothetical protein
MNGMLFELSDRLTEVRDRVAELKAVVTAGQHQSAELTGLRAEVEALQASRGELLALLEGWAYHGWNREREERSRALVDAAIAKAEKEAGNG